MQEGEAKSVTEIPTFESQLADFLKRMRKRLMKGPGAKRAVTSMAVVWTETNDTAGRVVAYHPNMLKTTQVAMMIGQLTLAQREFQDIILATEKYLLQAKAEAKESAEDHNDGDDTPET